MSLLFFNSLLFIFKNFLKYIYSIIIKKFEIILLVNYKYLFQTLFFLKKNSLLRFSLLMDIIGVDKPFSKNRFVLIYKLTSLILNKTILLKISFLQNISISSSLDLYSSAGWLEREVWDFFGIYFYNHSDLRRILTDYGFSGFPLRKDFPLTGYFEISYIDEKKRVVLELLDVTQEFRFFNFTSPWE